jgi:hypothetical protein
MIDEAQGIGSNVHRFVDILELHSTVDLFHSGAGLLHCSQGLVVDIRGLDGVYLLLELHNLSCCLLEILLVDLFASEGVLGGCIVRGTDS